MPNSNVQQVWPDVVELTPEQQALAALRAEIDAIDDQILALFEQRLAVAATVGRAKDAPCLLYTSPSPRD